MTDFDVALLYFYCISSGFQVVLLSPVVLSHFLSMIAFIATLTCCRSLEDRSICTDLSLRFYGSYIGSLFALLVVLLIL